MLPRPTQGVMMMVMSHGSILDHDGLGSKLPPHLNLTVNEWDMQIYVVLGSNRAPQLRFLATPGQYEAPGHNST